MNTLSDNSSRIGRVIQFFSPTALQIFFTFALPFIFTVVGYMYEEALQINYFTFILSIVVSLLVGSLMTISRVLTNVSYTIIHGFIIAPMFAVATYASSITLSTTHLIVVFCFLFFFFIADRMSQLFFSNNKKHLLNDKYDNFYVFVYMLIFLIILFKFGFRNIEILGTYKNQYEIRSYLSFDFPYSYMLNFWLGIFSAAPAIFLARKSYLLFLFSLFSVLYIYTIYPLAAIVFMSILILSLSMSINVFKKYFQYSNFYLLFLTFVITFFGVVWLVDHPVLYSIFNRAFYVIGWNTYYYIDFFINADLYLLRGSLMDLGSSYSEPIGFIIDRVYYSGEGSNQSSGGIANLYANGGLTGVIFGSILLGFLVNLAASISSNLQVSFILILSVIISFVNFPLQQLFLSNGFIFLFLIFFIRKILIKKYTNY